MTQFNEVLAEIKGGLSVRKNGKVSKTFSRNDFDKLAKAFVNEVGYTTETVSVRGGDLHRKEVKPVVGFRSLIQAILLDFGVDKKEAARVMEESYSIKSVNGLYEFVSELIYQYMEAGKKFDFLTKEDFVGGITLDEVEEETREYEMRQADGTSKTYKVTKDKHKVLNKKSKCPQWKKH